MRRPRVQFTVKRAMVSIAVVAGILGGAVGIHRRGESFKRLAAFHLQAHSMLVDRAGGSLACGAGLSDEDIDRIFCGQGPDECRAYKASMYHYAMYGKYERACVRPWLLVASDPPPPPAAMPTFEPESRYLEFVNHDYSGDAFR